MSSNKMYWKDLPATGLALSYFKTNSTLVNPVVVSPDAGGVKRAKDMQKAMKKQGYKDTDLAFIIK